MSVINVKETPGGSILPADCPVKFEHVSAASFRIRHGVMRTSCRLASNSSNYFGYKLYFKKEYRQVTGSFKERGARNALMLLPHEKKLKGVIAASAGNHALGLAYHGKDLGIPVTVIMPEVAPITKIHKCRALGARVVIHGAHIGESKEHAMQIAEKEGLSYINGYDDAEIIAGTGTIGLEILEQVPDVEAVMVPVGGAGLIAGIALAIKTMRPDVEVIGVEPERCASFSAALGAGKPVPVKVSGTLADGLAVPQVGARAFDVARMHVDRVITVSEKAIALSVLRLTELEKMVCEGAGAAALAPIIDDLVPELRNKKIVIPLCGGNIDTTTLGRIIERGLAADGRMVRFVVTVDDRPGGIFRLTKLLAREGASIKDIYHERAWLGQDIDKVDVKCICETIDREHAERVRLALVEAGYPLSWGPHSPTPDAAKRKGAEAAPAAATTAAAAPVEGAPQPAPTRGAEHSEREPAPGTPLGSRL